MVGAVPTSGYESGRCARARRAVHQARHRDALPAVQVPTLVLHRVGDRFMRVQHGQQLAASIPGARYVELAGDDHLVWIGDVNVVADEIEELLTGSRSGMHISD